VQRRRRPQRRAERPRKRSSQSFGLRKKPAEFRRLFLSVWLELALSNLIARPGLVFRWRLSIHVRQQSWAYLHRCSARDDDPHRFLARHTTLRSLKRLHNHSHSWNSRPTCPARTVRRRQSASAARSVDRVRERP
jgi:hypothetical protein